MKKFIGSLFFIGMLMLGGIAEGINEGASLSLALWSIPILLVMWAGVKLSD